MHYYKFNIADWVLHTAHLTLVEEAVYFRLINHYYDIEGPIPIETQPVIRRLRMAQEAEVVERILNEFFIKTDCGFSHKRCDELLKDYKKNNRKNKANGMKGGRPRKDAGCSETQTKPSGLFNKTQMEPKHNPNHKPRTTNQKLLTKNHKPGTKNQEPVLPDFLDKDLWSDFLDLRKKLKAPNTTRALNSLLKKLAKYHDEGHDANSIVQNSYDNGWRGLFDPKKTNNASLMSKNTTNVKSWIDGST